MAEGYLLLSLFASLLGQQDTVNVGKHTTSSNGDTTKQLAQLLVVAHCQLNVTGHYAGLLVVTRCIACQLKDLSLHTGLQHHNRFKIEYVKTKPRTNNSPNRTRTRYTGAPAPIRVANLPFFR